MPKYVCVHGHFYQPPRENPWLEAVEMQESAYPEHDWNERITRECYAPNAKARLLDSDNRIEQLVGNYERISFNFGPTLLSWLKERSPATYAAILAQDKASASRFGWHGSALAQGYNHAILPLCNDRDRRTQVLWGIADFESRFGRKPEGFWLPETAADTPTLEALAEAGILFTILAPRQAAKVRNIGQEAWHDIEHGVDTRRAYRCPLPSGRSISLFFYNGEVSSAVAFEGLLHSGDRFADRLLKEFNRPADPKEPYLVHIATDGESYGHHHRYGEMALAAALRRISGEKDIELTNYGRFLELHPPTMEIQIHEQTSWSCSHGVERWKSDCGCNAGRGEFHQKWRAPLRFALDWLRDSIAAPFENSAGEYFADPWKVRDRYIEVILDRSTESIQAFLSRNGRKEIGESDRTKLLELLEMQRNAMLMYTSCGWFFDDIAGMETVQILQYAGRVIQLARSALGLDLEVEFMRRLEEAKGNDPVRPDGRAVYERSVRPAMVDLPRVGAHYAITTLFSSNGPRDRVYCFDVRRMDEERRRSAGKARLLVGRANFISRITLARTALTYVVAHMGDHTVNCGVRIFQNEEAYARLYGLVEEAFDRADFPGMIRGLDREFGQGDYTISTLFRDEQHAVVREILEGQLSQIDASFRQIYEQNAPMTQFLRQLDLTVPRRIQMVGGFVLTQTIRTLLGARQIDLRRLSELGDEAKRQGIALDAATLGAAAREALARTAMEVSASNEKAETLEEMLSLARYIRGLPFHVDLWPAQEVFIEHVRPRINEQTGDPTVERWRKVIRELGEALDVKV